MSYSKKLETLILELKGGDFFLSPRDREFLKALEEMGVPEEVAFEGVRRCLESVAPKKRSKTPLFLCFSAVMEAFENWRRLKAYEEHWSWRDRFRKKIELVKGLIRKLPPEPRTEEEARRILSDLEKRILRNLWRRLPEEERKRILKKYSKFKENKDLYRELVKEELRKRFGLPNLSLYVD